MEIARKRIRQRRLETYGRILSSKYNINLKLKNMKGYGYCNSSKNIIVNEGMNKDEHINLIMQKAITLHEVGHVLFTSSTIWRDTDKHLLNIIADGRVEEAMSRLYPKARLYFIFANQRILPLRSYEISDDSDTNLERGIMDIIFRESMKKTGAPQFPKSMHLKLKKKLGIDYDWFLAKTRDAVEAKTEEEAAKITRDIEKRLRSILKKNDYSELVIVSPRGSLSSVKCGSSSRQMPEEDEDEKDEIEEIVAVLEEAADDTKDDTKDDKPDDKPDDSGNLLDIDVSVDVPSTDEKQDDDASTSDTDTNDIDGAKNADSSDDTNTRDADVDGLIKLMESINSQIENEISDELRNEVDQLKRNDVEGDFGDYGIDDTENVVYTKYGSKRTPIDSRKLENVANRISHSFKMIAERGDSWVHNKTRGKLEMHRLTKVIANDPRIFKNIDKKELNDISAVILLDASGSMSGDRCKLATEAAYIVSRALELGSYKSEALQFGGGLPKKIHGLKAFNQKLDYAKHKFIPTAECGTPLLIALKGAEKSLLHQKSKRRIIIVATDGYPNYSEECKIRINELENKGIAVIGILINTKDKYGIFHKDRRILCENVHTLPTQMSGVIKNVLMTIKR